MFSFRAHLRNERVFETKVKLFLLLKQKYFDLQTKMKVFPKRKWKYFETKMFYFENICKTKVFWKRK